MPWHNPSIVAPSLHQLATQGVVLEQNYVQPKCAPSRAALLTGRWETFADYCSDQISIAKVHFISLFPRFLNDLESFLLSILSNLDHHFYVHLTEFSRFLAITTMVLYGHYQLYVQVPVPHRPAAREPPPHHAHRGQPQVPAAATGEAGHQDTRTPSAVRFEIPGYRVELYLGIRKFQPITAILPLCWKIK